MLVLCGMPGDDLPNNPWLEMIHFDKCVHAGLHAIFTYFILRGMNIQQGFLQMKHYSIAIGISFGYGILIELMQTYVFIHRSGDSTDVAANIAGAIAAATVFKKLPRIFIS